MWGIPIFSANCRANVVFPDPDDPTIAIRWPGGIFNSGDFLPLRLLMPSIVPEKRNSLKCFVCGMDKRYISAQLMQSVCVHIFQ